MQKPWLGRSDFWRPYTKILEKFKKVQVKYQTNQFLFQYFFFRFHVYAHLKNDIGFWEQRLQYLEQVDARYVKYECDLCPFGINWDTEIPRSEKSAKKYKNYNIKILDS